MNTAMPSAGDAGTDRRPSLSVIVPAFNEAIVLMRSLTVVYEYLQGISSEYAWELLVVDDGSTDETPDIADAFARDRSEVRVLHHPRNFNLGQALRFAFARCHGDYVVVIDCDLSYSVDHIGRLVTALREEHAKIAIASPYMPGGRITAVPYARRMLSRQANRILGATTQDRLHTVTSMVRAYDRLFLSSLNLKAMGPEVNTEILYKAQLLRAHVVEVPAHLDWSGQAERMAARGRHGLRIRKTTLLQLFSSFLFRPLVFFVLPGLLMLAIATWTLGSVFVSVVRTYAHLTGSFDPRLTKAVAATYKERPQSFIVGGFCLLVSIQLISLGLMAIQAKRYFEELFHLGTNILRRQLSDAESDRHRPD
jgi:glycosyltransferase involved in cell wall biosynthesis